MNPCVPALVFSLFAWNCMAQSPAGLDSESLSALLEEVRTKHDLPALAAAVVTDSGPVLIEVVGVRKRGDRTKAQKNDMFHLGSCSKAFTGWLAAWAVENGKLRWDSTLGEVFPRQSRKWPASHKQITLGQLLTHVSGIQADASRERLSRLPKGLDYWPRQSGPEVKGRETKKQRLEFVEAAGELPLATDPGTTFAYSNNNQILAAAMIEEATGKPWEDLLEEQIFRPLQMKETGHGSMGKPGPIKQPWQHEENGTPIPPDPRLADPEVMGPSSRLHMSMDSWARFVAEILRGAQGKGTLLKKETYDDILRPPGYTKGCWESGVETGGDRATSLVHAGSNTWNFAIADIRPSENFAILVATNQGDLQPRETPPKIGDACRELVARLMEMRGAR